MFAERCPLHRNRRSEGLEDAEHVAQHTLGVDKLCARAAEFPPEHCAEITGLKKEEIVSLAREYAKAKPSTIRTIVGLEHHANGAMPFRTIA